MKKIRIVKRTKPNNSGNPWRKVPPLLGGGKERKHKEGRIHEHWLRDDKHVDKKDPVKDPWGHLCEDIIGGGKGAPVTREWTRRYRMIDGKKTLVLVRKENGKEKIKIIK